MNVKLSSLFLFCSVFLLAQNKIFTHPIQENNLSSKQKITKESASSYTKTFYYQQDDFDLSSDLRIVLPNNKEITAKPRQKFSYPSKSISYAYKINNDPNAELVFSDYDGAITGMYASSSGEKIMFQKTDDNIYAVSIINESSIIAQDSKNDQIIANDNPFKSTLANANVCLENTPICPNTTIDVLVVYTTDAKLAWGGTSLSNSAIATAITNFNIALQNSGVSNVTINLVYSGEIDYVESGDISVDLSRFRNTTDGFMDDVHTLRSTYGADLCALITSTPTNTCGLGYLNTNPSNYSSNAAFTVSLRNCAVSNYTLAHEMGHNMGLNHDWYVNTSIYPCENQHGYINRTAINNGTNSVPSERWRTIMAYNDECTDFIGASCTRINRWANPDVIYNGESTGLAIGNINPSNEAFGFMRFACVVSGFMPTANLATSEVNEEVSEIKLYPNPVSDIINISVKDNKTYSFTIIDMTGKLILKTNETSIIVKNWASGQYVLNINNGQNKLVKSIKFIVK